MTGTTMGSNARVTGPQTKTALDSITALASEICLHPIANASHLPQIFYYGFKPIDDFIVTKEHYYPPALAEGPSPPPSPPPPPPSSPS